jgi:uncharacterized protein (DUF2141 family)
MSNRSSRITALTLAIVTALVSCIPAPATAQGSRYSLTLVNRTGYAIEQIYISPSDTNDWGSDQLGRRILVSGSSFTFTNIRPGEYDIKFVDEDGDTCKLSHQNVFNNLSWELSQSWLLSCESH